MSGSFWSWFKIAVAVGAGVEIGRNLPEAFAYALNKKNREHYRKLYRDTVEKETAKQNAKQTIRVVPDQGSETPTGV